MDEDDVAGAGLAFGDDAPIAVAGEVVGPVSYTHLTLPTSDLV